MKFLKLLASKPGFFSMGITSTCFNPDGSVGGQRNTDDPRDKGGGCGGWVQRCNFSLVTEK